MGTLGRKPHPDDAICTAGDDHISGIPLVALGEGDAQDVWQRPAGRVAARQQLALHVPQVEERPRA